MSKRVVTAALNNIKKCVYFLKCSDINTCKKTLKTLGVHKQVYERAYSLKLFRIPDIEKNLDNLNDLYDNDGGKLTTLSRNLRNICKKYPGWGVVDKKKKQPKQPKPVKTDKEKHEKIIRKIKRQSIDCCLCLRLCDLSKLSEKEFIDLIKSNFNKVTGHKLESSRTRSWKDEYKQFKNVFIPTFQEYDKRILNFHIVFELKLPQKLKDLDSGDFVFADAIIVAEDGVVVLEFKQRDSEAINYDVKQAVKYMHRLRYHKISRHQHSRYTYVVYTKEDDDSVYKYDDKKDFWYGSSEGVAKDLCTQFFDDNEPLSDIKEWLNAGYKKKKSK